MTINHGNPYTAGYEAAFREIYAAVNEEGHAASCGECRPCGVFKEIVELLMDTLASKCTQEEFFSLAMIFNRRERPKGGGGEPGHFGVIFEHEDIGSGPYD